MVQSSMYSKVANMEVDKVSNLIAVMVADMEVGVVVVIMVDMEGDNVPDMVTSSNFIILLKLYNFNQISQFWPNFKIMSNFGQISISYHHPPTAKVWTHSIETMRVTDWLDWLDKTTIHIIA